MTHFLQLKWNRRNQKLKSTLAPKSISSLNPLSTILSRKDPITQSFSQSIGSRLMLKNILSKKILIQNAKRKKLLLNLRLRSKRKSNKANHKAEWLSLKKLLECLTKNNLQSLLKFLKAKKQSFSSNLLSETLSFSKILIGKMKILSSKLCQRRNSKVVIL